MFNRETKSHYPEVFLRPKETINIPFKYLSYAADQSVKPQGPVDPFRQEMKTKARQLDALKTKAIKVSDNTLCGNYSTIFLFATLHSWGSTLKMICSLRYSCFHLRAGRLDVVLCTSRMRWFGHVECSTGWIAKVCKLNVVAQKRQAGRKKHGMKC